MKSLAVLLLTLMAVVAVVWTSSKEDPAQVTRSPGVQLGEDGPRVAASAPMTTREVTGEPLAGEQVEPDGIDREAASQDEPAGATANRFNNSNELAPLQAELEIATQNMEHLSMAELEALATRARSVVSGLVTEELSARRAAGLSSTVAAFVPGAPLEVKRNKALFEAFTAEGDVWRRTDLPRDQYQQLYTVHEMTMQLEDRLEGR